MNSYKRVNDKGFTLIELLVVMAMIAILAAIGAPSFSNLLDKNKRAATLNEMLGHLKTSRSESIKRGETVSICKSTDGETCVTTGNWESGWLIFVDPDADGVVEDANGDGNITIGSEILKVRGALDSGTTLRSSVNFISYQRNGTTANTTTFTYCDNRGAGYAAAIILNTAGQQRTSETEVDGSSLTCPS